ncbi:MAG: tetratricopeptide repeat protein [Zoogloeaceae bacterium]|nr:tetratricopeptide repeat protein [Zoogloeaceae bacterium]
MNNRPTKWALRACIPWLLAGGVASAAGPGTPAESVRRLPGQELTAQIFYEFLLAEVAGARGQFQVAIPAYLDLSRRTRDPRIARRATEMALYARQFGAAGEAARIWSDVDPDSADARKVLAGLLIGRAAPRLEEAQAHLARVLAQSGESLPQNLLGLNRAFGEVQDKAAVRTAIERVTEPYLQLPEAHFARAQAAYGAGDSAAALAELDLADARRGDWELAVLLRAQILQTEDPAQASKTMAAYIARHPDSLAGRVAYARALAGERRLDEAYQEFKRLLADRPDEPDLLNAAGVLALELDKYDEADELLRRLLARGPRDIDGVRLLLGQIADQKKQFAEAVDWYAAVEGETRRPEARLRMAHSLAAAGRIDEARNILQSLPQDAPDAQARIRLAEAQILRDAGKVAEAFEVVEAALRGQPDNTDLLYEAAMLAERQNHLEVMEFRLRKLIALKPDSAHAYNALGYALADRGLRLEEAEALIRKALELSPDDPFITDSLGWVRFRRGDATGAAQVLETAYRLRADPEIAAHLGEVYWSLGRQEDARRTWNQALQAHPDNSVIKAAMKRLMP